MDEKNQFYKNRNSTSTSKTQKLSIHAQSIEMPIRALLAHGVLSDNDNTWRRPFIKSGAYLSSNHNAHILSKKKEYPPLGMPLPGHGDIMRSTVTLIKQQRTWWSEGVCVGGRRLTLCTSKWEIKKTSYVLIWEFIWARFDEKHKLCV